jgi:hypothetical protein
MTFSNRAAAMLRQKTGRGLTIHSQIKIFDGLAENGSPMFRDKHGYRADATFVDKASVVGKQLADDLRTSRNNSPGRMKALAGAT